MLMGLNHSRFPAVISCSNHLYIYIRRVPVRERVISEGRTAALAAD